MCLERVKTLWNANMKFQVVKQETEAVSSEELDDVMPFHGNVA